jgi:hypothetical protein
MADKTVYIHDIKTRAFVPELFHDNGDGTYSRAVPPLLAGTAAIGKIITPTFSASDSLTRPANTTAYAAQKSINIDLTVTAVAYTLKVVTLTSNGHGLVVGDRITVAGVNAGGSPNFANIDGNWVITAKDANTITFTVAIQPTGTTPQTGLTITHAIAKMLSVDVGGVVGGGGKHFSQVILPQPEKRRDGLHGRFRDRHQDADRGRSPEHGQDDLVLHHGQRAE